MKILEREIGDQLDGLFEEVALSLVNAFAKNASKEEERSEIERKLSILPQDDGLLSRIQWVEDNPYIYIRSDIPTHAMPHVLGAALCHVKQKIDQFPDVVQNENEEELDGSLLVRIALKELLMSLNAEEKMKDIKFNIDWEDKNRHQGFKDLLGMLDRDQDDGFVSTDHPTHQFFSLTYAKFSLIHPPKMWDGLKTQIKNDYPEFVESGNKILEIIDRSGFKDVESCLKSLTDIRDEIAMRPYTLILDRRDSSYY
jgi:hypothetical protein